MVASVLTTVLLLGSVTLFFVFARERVIRRLAPVWARCPGIFRGFLSKTPMGLRVWLQFVAFIIFIFALDLAGRHMPWPD